MSAEIIPTVQYVERLAQFTLHIEREWAEDLALEQTVEQDRFIERTAQLTLFIDPEVA